MAFWVLLAVRTKVLLRLHYVVFKSRFLAGRIRWSERLKRFKRLIGHSQMHRLPLEVQRLNRQLRGQALVVLVAPDVPNRVVRHVLTELPLRKLALLQAAIVAAPA